MRKITVEELEIIVEASVKGALDEFKKIKPRNTKNSKSNIKRTKQSGYK